MNVHKRTPALHDLKPLLLKINKLRFGTSIGITQAKNQIMITDDKLKSIWKGCLNNDRKQQELLYRVAAPKLLQVCRNYTKDKDEAQDILQEGMIKIFNNLHHYRGEGSFEGWMRRIIVHTAISRFRKLKPLVYSSEIADDCVLHPVTRNNHKLELKEMMAMINQLPTSYRSVFNMYAIEGYSHEEIGASLGISQLLSRTTLHRARGVLRKQINRLQQKESYCLAG